MVDILGLAFTAVSLLIAWSAWVFAAVLLVQLGMYVMAYVNSLYVEGKPNEWVVIMHNGELKQAGIGLSAFVSPFDNVAIFPSQLSKVEIRT